MVRGNVGVMDIFIILIALMMSLMHAYVKIYEIVHCKDVFYFM